MPNPLPLSRLALPVTLIAGLAACSSPVREVVYQEGEVEVSRRAYREDGEVVARGYQHPATVEVRPLAYALAEIEAGDLDHDAEPRPAIPVDLLAPIARGLAAGFAEAGPDEELVVVATRKEKTIGIFHRRLLTSFVATRRDGELWLSFAYTDHPLTKKEEREERPLPEIGAPRMEFRIRGTAAVRSPRRELARLDWPESAPEVAAPAAAATPAAGATAPTGGSPAPEDAAGAALAPAAAAELRALEEALERGEIAPVYYERKRAELLEGAGGEARTAPE